MRAGVFFLASALAFAQGGTGSVDGLWEGTLDAGAIKLRLVFHLNGHSGTFDSLDQGATGVPVATVELKNRSVAMDIPVAHASYVGTLSESGNEIQGTFTQGQGIPLTLRRIEKAPDTSRPQDPQKPYPYTEEEVVIGNTKANVKLAGTLTLPKGKGPFAAVVMITGSGPQNRNEELMGHRPFLVIADRLTQNGIAVLRVDDRGIGKSTGNFNASTTLDFAGDTLACVEFLKARTDIDHARIGLIGHSEGGVIAPMVASQTRDVAFVVMLAGTAVPGRDVLLEQQRTIGKLMSIAPDRMKESQDLNEQLYAIVAQDLDAAMMNQQIEALVEKQMAPLSEEQRKDVRPKLAAQLKQAASPWLRFFIRYNPAPALRKLRCPVLAMNGELDAQVIATQNLPAVAKALEEGGNRDYEIVKLPGLNHLFQTAKTGLPDEYSKIEETISPVALDVMTAWILRHVQ